MRKNLQFKILALLILCSGILNAQQRTISGRVTFFDDGSALPGVNVLLKGTSTGTSTDAEGKYTLSVPSAGGVLVFSFIGLKSMEVEIATNSVIDAAMHSDATELSEVVVTALGIERTKNELSYSAQKVDGDAISQTRDNNFVNGLSGKVAGLDIKRPNSMGGSTNVVIRGNKSLTGNNQALFIVDGVPIDNSNTNGANQQTGGGGYDYGNAAADINPDDIASINVLKGAAATALYGSRASNGVILITTKKGRGSKGLGITVNSGVTIGKFDKSTFTRYQKKYGEGYGAYYEDDSGFFLSRDVDGDGNDDLVAPMSEDASWGAAYDKDLMVYQWESFDPLSPKFGKASPWVAAKNDPSKIFQTAVSKNYSLLLDNTGDRGYFKLGYTANDERGIMPNSSLHKDFLNFGAGFNITEKFTANASINVSNVTGKGRYGSGYDDKNLMTNFRQWWNVGTDIKAQKAAYYRNKKAGGTGNTTWNWADPDDLTPIYWDNPYFTRNENYENDNRLRTFGYTSLNYKVASWLDIMGRVSFDGYDELQEERQAVGSVTTSAYSRFNRSFREYNYDLMASMNKDLSQDLNLKAVVGTNIRKTHIESIFANTNGGLVVPRLYALTNSVNPIIAPIETSSDLEVDGVFANTTFGYKDLLFLDLAGRRDQSSSLPKGNNVYYYPSSSLSFVFSELLKNVTWLTGGKFRVNYAEVGNTAPVQSVLDSYDKPTAFGNVPLFSVNGTKNNPDLKPERTKSFEVGTEMSFLDGRVGFDFTYYRSNTVDQIVPAPVSASTGYNLKFINAGNVQNQGVEISAFGSPVKTTNFSWTINVNWTRNRNKVIELAEGIDNLQLGAYQGGVSINASLGKPYGTIRGSNFVYNNKGQKLVDEDGYYQISSTSNEVIGNINPDWIMGVNNTLKYKNITFSFLIDTKKGGDLFSLDMYYGLATGILGETAGKNHLGNPIRDDLSEGGGWLNKGVKDDGTPNDVMIDASAANGFGTFGYVYNPARAFIYDASYVKLREVTLGYSFPQSLISKLGPIKGIDVSFVGRNLWIIHKNTPYSDPEDGLGSGNLASGYQVGSYPNVRQMGFNVKFKF